MAGRLFAGCWEACVNGIEIMHALTFCDHLLPSLLQEFMTGVTFCCDTHLLGHQ